MNPNERAELEGLAKEIRKLAIEMIGTLGVGHIGGAMSIADALAVLYGKHLTAYPVDPRASNRDRLVLSKGHAGPALYAVLAAKGFFPREWLSTLNKGGTNLPSHCDRNRTPGIDMTTGSLGQGLSAACGIASALRMDGNSATVFAIIGDGESDEGQNWEAAMFASQAKLANLIAFTDYNRAQIDGTTDEIVSLGELSAKWAAFGWNAIDVDGHDVAALDQAIERGKAQTDRPTMIVMHTVKGKGCSFCEGQVSSHNMPVTMEMAAQAIAALGA
ncbi:MAG: transketolase [Spirochaetales bacterium]|nr:transketolase [Spirochaetales bacterium]